MTALSDEELLDVMAAWRRVTSWAQASELAVVAEFIRRREETRPSTPPVELGEFIADEIALALTLSGGAAAIWAGLAGKLAAWFPLTREALREGRIDLTRAKAIVDGLFGVDTATIALVEAAVIGDARSMNAARLRRRVRAALAEVDPQAATERKERARKVRSLQMWATAAGTCDLALREVSAEDAEAIYNKINAVAQAMKADGDARPIDAIRHDLGIALLRGTPLPEAAGDLHQDDADCGGNPRDRGREHPNDQADSAPGSGCGDGRSAEGGTGRTDQAYGVARSGCGDRRAGDGGPDSAGEDEQARGGTGTGPRSPDQIMPPSGRRDRAGSLRRAGRSEPMDRSGEDTVDMAARRLATLLAGVIDDRLAMITGQEKASGRRSGLAMRVAAAAQAMTSALADLKPRWCDATTSGRTTGDPITVDGQTTSSGNIVAVSALHGHGAYRPPAAMKRLIQHNHQICAFPSCNRKSTRCDLDHTVPFHKGGPTCSCNLAPLCRHHHRLKQDPQWHLFQPWPGLLVWVTPAGKWHTVIPEDRQ
ncbi:DUF222 domain-containing protein [Actinomadura scrupuli]|uniref:HNH endonuclease signature motif containing protein n=1 Tax=Actinomadura scrupuli TaxID=559629 RepID=UPI003D96E2D5